MKKLVTTVLFVLIAATTIAKSSHLAEALSPPEAFVEHIGNDIIQLIRSSQGMSQKKEHFRQLLKTHFDMTAIGRFVLGRNWRLANATEQQEFLKLFEQNMVDTYTSQFDEYKDETMTVLKSRKGEDDAIWVETQVRGSEREPLKVRWKLYEKNGKYLVYDIYVNEASMSITHRSEYATIIQSHGGQIQGLLNELRKNTSKRAKETKA